MKSIVKSIPALPAVLVLVGILAVGVIIGAKQQPIGATNPWPQYQESARSDHELALESRVPESVKNTSNRWYSVVALLGAIAFTGFLWWRSRQDLPIPVEPTEPLVRKVVEMYYRPNAHALRRR